MFCRLYQAAGKLVSMSSRFSRKLFPDPENTNTQHHLRGHTDADKRATYTHTHTVPSQQHKSMCTVERKPPVVDAAPGDVDHEVCWRLCVVSAVLVTHFHVLVQEPRHQLICSRHHGAACVAQPRRHLRNDAAALTPTRQGHRLRVCFASTAEVQVEVLEVPVATETDDNNDDTGTHTHVRVAHTQSPQS